MTLCMLLNLFFQLLDEDYEKIETPVARDELISKYTLTQVKLVQVWS